MPNESVRDTIKRSIDQLYEASDELAGKKTKEEVGYSESTGRGKCGNCEHFEKERKNGCTEVIGRIEAPYWCKEYEREGKGGEKGEASEDGAEGGEVDEAE